MKLLTQKIVSALLSFLVLFSTISFTVDKHFCKGKLVDISYFGAAESCGMLMLDRSCSDESINDGSCKSKTECKKDCCDDEAQLIKGQDTFWKTSSDKIKLLKKPFFVFIINPFSKDFINPAKDFFLPKLYKPPNLFIDINVLFEVFRI